MVDSERYINKLSGVHGIDPLIDKMYGLNGRNTNEKKGAKTALDEAGAAMIDIMKDGGAITDTGVVLARDSDQLHLATALQKDIQTKLVLRLESGQYFQQVRINDILPHTISDINSGVILVARGLEEYIHYKFSKDEKRVYLSLLREDEQIKGSHFKPLRYAFANLVEKSFMQHLGDQIITPGLVADQIVYDVASVFGPNRDERLKGLKRDRLK